MNIEQYFESGEEKQLKGHFANLILVAKADGKIGTKEEELLKKMAKSFNITEDEFQDILQEKINYSFIAPVNKEDRYSRFINLVRMMIADGEIQYFEYRTLLRFGAGLSFRDDKIEYLIEKTVEALKNNMDLDDIIESYDKWIRE